MAPLPFWQLLLGLICILVAGHVLAWWAWRALAFSGPRLGRGITGMARRRKALAWLQRRAPATTRFVGARLTVERFSGLPLTLIAGLAVYLVFLGAGLLEDLFEGEELVQFDQHVNSALAVVRNPHFLEFAGAITALANLETLIAITLVSTGFLWAHRRFAYIPGLLVTVIGSQAITYIGKYAIARDRPDFLTFASASTPSFPSGHATGAIAVYGFIIYAIARDIPGVRRRFELAYWGCALIALIAASRAILSVHFASDIAAGLLVGGFWLLSGFALTEYLRQRADMPGR
ncbi:phosphoesterase PA-phosphatase-like protein [Salinisphaera dokdonensis CL-ES53]|uniref:undecaprenyl-diphosphate phosphatase n=1 Tax=Salinisphaera dokdonensis CL-ES53 TaxID=1304272 RepID=A0ABV2AZV5_9GAMM